MKKTSMPAAELKKLIDQLSGLSMNLYQQDFLLSWERSYDEVVAVITLAEVLEQIYRDNVSLKVFDSGLAVAHFRDQSTRTRFSFASAANLLGLCVQEIDEKKSQVAHGETVRETANMISFLTEVIGVRDDIFLGEGHKYMAEVSASVDEGFREGVLAQRPAVINLQCDLDHPTQSLADLLHLKQTFGSLDELRGRKLAMTWAYSPSYGKPLSVPQGIIGLLTRFGMNVVLAHPPGYELVPDVVKRAGQFTTESDGSFQCVESMEAAFADADVVYPKSWAPMQVMKRRTGLLKKGDDKGLQELEQECLANNARYRNWECGEKLMSSTRGGKALYMHCLPADISGVSCESGEVEAGVFEKYRLATYHEASHKPFVIAAMMLLTRFEKSERVLNDLLKKSQPRRWVAD